jgi:uncharacterized protein (TIGR04222 family)
MTSVLPVIGLVGALVTTMLATWGRRQWLRAPRGSAARVLDVYDLAYLAGGPERTTVTLVASLVRRGMARVDDTGAVRLADDWMRAEWPEDGREAEVLRLLDRHGEPMSLPQLAKGLQCDSMRSVDRLRRWHLLPGKYQAPRLLSLPLLLSVTFAAAGIVQSVRADEIPGVVIGLAALVVAAGGVLLARRSPRVPVTDAGREVLVTAYTHYKRGGMPDMAGHGVALRGAAAIGDPDLRERLGELEAAQTAGWTWDPATSPLSVLTPGVGYNPGTGIGAAIGGGGHHH